MNYKTFRLLVISFSLIILVISLTQNAITVDKHTNEDNSGLLYFLMGATAIIGGGTSEWLIWLANPLCLLSMVFLFKSNGKLSISLAIIASMLAFSFLNWKEILISESGSTGKILTFEMGYYLWLASIFIYALGVTSYFAIYGNVLKSIDKKPQSLEELREELKKNAKR